MDGVDDASPGLVPAMLTAAAPRLLVRIRRIGKIELLHRCLQEAEIVPTSSVWWEAAPAVSRRRIHRRCRGLIISGLVHGQCKDWVLSRYPKRPLVPPA